jgi:hypothetical protein
MSEDSEESRDPSRKYWWVIGIVVPIVVALIGVIEGRWGQRDPGNAATTSNTEQAPSTQQSPAIDRVQVPNALYEPAAHVTVTDMVVRPRKEKPGWLAIEAVASLENVGKVPIVAGCAEATAILTINDTPTGWRLLGQQLQGRQLPACNVNVPVGESRSFPIFIAFPKPSEDSIRVRLTVQFHKDAMPVSSGRDDSRVWVNNATAQMPSQ